MPTVDTDTLTIAYEVAGSPDGSPVVLMHGFPDDVHTWDAVVPELAADGYRVYTPYLRGYGPTRFRSAETLRSGEQAALGDDLRAFLDALGIARATLGGFDWGGRAACIVAALWPERVRGLLTINGYNIQDITRAGEPRDPEAERRYWYQWYLHTERGRAGLAAHRRELTRLLWREWSPNYAFDDATFERTAVAFDNPDFVDVVVHSYRHRYGVVAGDPKLAAIDAALAKQPSITVRAIVLHGACDTVDPPPVVDRHADRFTGGYTRAIVPVAGHFFPREAPGEVAAAIRELAG